MATTEESVSVRITNVVDGKLYAIGGARGNAPFGTVEVYDPRADTWTQKADMPTTRGGLATVVVDGKIYAIGGARGNAPFTTVEVYDSATDT